MLIWILAAAVLVVVTGICLFCYFFTFFNFHKQKSPYKPLKGEQYAAVKVQSDALIARMEQQPYEAVSVCAEDGVRLWGRYYHYADDAPLQVQVHGYKGHALRDMCGAHMLARELGHNILVIDQRAHGNSGGHTIAFGERECEDVRIWIEYMADRLGREKPVILSGVSMGAATVLLCSAMEMKAKVVGVIADSPYASARGIIAKVARDMGLPPRLVMPFLLTGARVFGGLHLHTDVCAAVARARVPILIIHGEDDRFVPCSMSREILQHAPQYVQLETFADAGHGLSFMTDFDRYKAHVIEFIEKIL